ncbi:MAG: hypothetical protein WD314_03000, partial [Trueperaceae bacterium]
MAARHSLPRIRSRAARFAIVGTNLMILKFISERIFHMILVMWMVATLVFFIFRILPGDPAQMVLGLEPSRASLEALREQMGLNRPLMVQYGDWLL